ncbi:MAG: tetratricopeptide repeat protein [Candidatus Doudnabacteria bacterium]|nr:tetratricopeptide repeat protein [Candidatus Doudnabacteria bacterium]
MVELAVSKTQIKRPSIVVGRPPGLGQEEKWDRVIRGFIYALAFLLPLSITTWTVEPLEFSKQMLLFVLTAGALVTWILRLIVLRTIRLVKTPLDMPVLAFGALYLLAAIFSVDRVASFLGFYGSFSGNFFQILFLILFYYVVINNFRTVRAVRLLVSVFFFSLFLALAYVVLQFFGVFLLRFAFAKTESFNSLGGLLLVSLLAAFVLVLAVAFPGGRSVWRFPDGRVFRIGAIVLALLILLTINFTYAWAALLVGLLMHMIAQIAWAREFAMKTFITPLVILILVISFLTVQFVFPFVNMRSIFNFNLPVEVRLDYRTAAPVIMSTLRDRPILGEGPNTFSYAFSRYRSQNFNLSPFWNVKFDRAPSEAAEYLVGAGLLGFLAFELIGAIFLLYGLMFLKRKQEHPGWRLAAAVYAAFVSLWLAHWFFFFNTVIAFSFWMMMAAFLAITRLGATAEERDRVVSFSFAEAPRRAVTAVSLASFGFVMIVVFLLFASSVYAADIFYTRGLRRSGQAETFDRAQQSFEQAIRLNQFRPDYFLTYGEFLFLRINQELSKKTPNPVVVQQWLLTAINTSRAAVEISPDNWAAWERLANLYTTARPLVAGVDKFIIDSLKNATERDAKNPILFTELGQIYRLAARQIDPGILGRGVDTDSDGLSDEQEKAIGSDLENPDSNGNGSLDGNEVLAGLAPASTGSLPAEFLAQYIKTDPEALLRAEEAFKKAIALKEDYAAAYYQLALTYEQQNKLDLAQATLEQALERFPRNITIKFELGIAYYNSGKVNEAARQFQEVVLLDPNNQNAHYSLAVAYERLGRLKAAVLEYQKLGALIPDNIEIQNKIKALLEALSNTGTY